MNTEVRCVRCKVSKDWSEFEMKESGEYLKTCTKCRNKRNMTTPKKESKRADNEYLGGEPKYIDLLRRPL